MAHAVMDEADIYYMLPMVEAFIRGYCFYRLVKPFMAFQVMGNGVCISEEPDTSAAEIRKGVFCIGAVYFLAMLLLYMRPLYMDVYTAYGIGSLVTFVFICLVDRRNYRQKAFLAVMFFSLNWLSAAMAEILYDNLYAAAWNTDYMKNHPGMSLALYITVCVVYLTLEFAFTVIGIRQILKVYRNKSADIKSRELNMLSLPPIIGVIAYKIIQKYRMFYIVETGKNHDILTMLFYVVSVIAIIVVIMLYQDIRDRQEKELQNELLFTQMDSIGKQIEQLENLYQDIRSVRHDMTNHILALERLYEGSRAEEAKAYSKDLMAELARMADGMESGNPVTDVILQELNAEAEKRGISFYSEFHYPADSNINTFDISIILNNALQNAIENTEKEKEKRISIVSYRRNNAYII